MKAEPQLNAAFMPQLALAFAYPVNLAARHEMSRKAATGAARQAGSRA
ncbi:MULTISPECIES: hypothetical protein [unclassified Mesorhizobium]|nr:MULTISPECIES: hypothetical protein [unclassified Mesorhizobium]